MSGLFSGGMGEDIKMPADHHHHQFLRRMETESDGLLNEGKGCWGHCDKTAGDCDYCGTGQCCREVDFRNGVEGCEMAQGISGARCGNWKNSTLEPTLRNEGLSCWGACDGSAGDCDYCGNGQCCRRVDGDRCVPGCELAATNANWIDGPGSQCGYFKDETTPCEPTVSTPPTNNNDNQDEDQELPAVGGLLHEGQACGGRCNFEGGDCDWCGTGQCCDNNGWYRGVPGCELAEGQAVAICGDWNAPYPEPDEFRLGMPLGTAPTPESLSSSEATTNTTGWIREIRGEGEDAHTVPEYDGEGGKPWSEFEMSLVRDEILREIRRASPGRDEVSGAKFLRLSFHDCLRYTDGEGGCDGCLNWDNMGVEVGGVNGRTEDREFNDNERKQSNNGLQDVVQFLEHLYNFDFGQRYASGCWSSPATIVGNAHVADTRANPIWVTSEDECHQLCLETEDCFYFTVPQIPFVNSRGPCRLFGEAGSMRNLLVPNGRLIAGQVNCPHESWSLRSTGKSRADLWAFASLVAVEEGIQRHNWACDGDRRSPHGGPIMCTQFEGEDQCKINPARPFVFKTGRKDCETTLEEPYMSEKIEAFPDEHFNGTMTVRFMEEHFGFSGKETVAIMGAHTMGRFQQRFTGHKYVWTSDFQAFNNQFYRNIAGREDWFFDDDECTKVGDAWGNKGRAVWIAKMNQVFRTGGPIQWIQKKVVCPNCAARSYERGGRHPERLAQDRDCCLNNVPEGAFCRPDGVGPVGSSVFERDDDFSDGCEYSHFIFGNDEAAMGSDMGLMYKFDVDIRGFPSGCPGLQTFYPSANRFSDWTCGIDGRPWFENPNLSWDNPNLSRVTKDEWTDHGCPADCYRQDYQYPGDHMTLADHVERYADDQAAWINDYMPIQERMIENGYQEDELVVSYSGFPSTSAVSDSALTR